MCTKREADWVFTFYDNRTHSAEGESTVLAKTHTLCGNWNAQFHLWWVKAIAYRVSLHQHHYIVHCVKIRGYDSLSYQLMYAWISVVVFEVRLKTGDAIVSKSYQIHSVGTSELGGKNVSHSMVVVEISIFVLDSDVRMSFSARCMYNSGTVHSPQHQMCVCSRTCAPLQNYVFCLCNVMVLTLGQLGLETNHSQRPNP